MVRGSNPAKINLFRLLQTSSGAHRASYSRFFSRELRQPGLKIDHSFTSKSESKMSGEINTFLPPACFHELGKDSFIFTFD